MRLAFVSLMTLAATAAVAQTPGPTPPPAPSSQAPAPAASAPPASTATAPAPTPAPSPAPSAAETPPAPPAPPPPPAPPTDPAAIAVLAVLQNVCIPAANGGDMGKLAKAGGFRKSGDSWSLRQKDFSLTIESQGSNPNQCHVDVIHTADIEAPGKPIIVALHNWAAVSNGWSLYRNDKSVQDGVEYTTRSWELAGDAKSESLVFTTRRHADGTPLRNGADESELIYAVTKPS